MKKLPYIFISILLFTVTGFSQNDVQFHLNSAKELELNEKYDEAIFEINKAIELQPQNSDLFYRRANVYKHLNDVKNVLKDVQTAYTLTLNANLPGNGWKQRCADLQCEERIEIADYLLSKSEQKHIAQKHIAYIVRYQSRFQIRDYKGTIEDIINSGNILSAFNEGVKFYVNTDNELEKTEGLLSKTLNQLKDDSNIYDYYEELFRFVESKKEGPATFGSGMLLYSLKINLYSNYASLYQAKKTPKEVEALFEKYANYLGLEVRADIYTKLKNYDAAIKDLTKVLTTTRFPVNCLYKRADLFVLTNRFRRAIADYETIKLIDNDLAEPINEKIIKVQNKIKKSSIYK